jgi:hypothetical protein
MRRPPLAAGAIGAAIGHSFAAANLHEQHRRALAKAGS